MTEVISQIWIGVLLAGIIGGITGWFLRGNGKKRLQELETNWKQRYQQLAQEKEECQENIEHLHIIRHERNALSNKLKQMQNVSKMHAGLEARLENLHQALENKNQQFLGEQKNVAALEKKIKTMQTLMREKDQMVHKITEKLANTGGVNKEKQDYIEKLERETSDLQQRLANTEKKMLANDAQVQQLLLNAEHVVKSELPDESEQVDAISAQELQQAQNEVNELRTHLDSANLRIQEDQEKINRLVNELPVMMKQIKDLNEEAKVKDHEIEALQQILDEKVMQLEKVDALLDEHRMLVLDANSKIEVLYDALDKERDENQQLNADNKLKDFRLAQSAENEENKDLEIKALYEKLTSAEFDSMGANENDLHAVSAHTLDMGEVENERKALLEKCAGIETELSHYKIELESKDKQLALQQRVSHELQGKLDRIQNEVSTLSINEQEVGLTPEVADDAPDATEPDDVTSLEMTNAPNEDDVIKSDPVTKTIDNEPLDSSFTDLKSVEMTEGAASPKALEVDESIDPAAVVSDDIDQTSLGDKRGVEEGVESEVKPTDVERTETNTVVQDLENAHQIQQRNHLVPGLMTSVALSVGVSEFIEEEPKDESADDLGVSSRDSDAMESEEDTADQLSEAASNNKVSILGWYENDTPQINLLKHGADSVNADVQNRLTLDKLEGMSATKMSKLRSYGISSIRDLYEFSRITKGKRSTLESMFNADEWRTWLSHSDLMRIDGMNITECQILNALGVMSVEDLSKVGESELKGKIHQLKRKQKIAAAVGPNTVSNWVKASKAMIESEA